MSDDQSPKCVRAIITLIYADNTSTVVDLKDPESTEFHFERPVEESSLYPVWTVKKIPNTTLVFSASLCQEEYGTTFSSYPVKE